MMITDLKNTRLQQVLNTHFDQKNGTVYWLERSLELGIDLHRDIRTIDDLIAFGPMDECAMSERPLEDFVPRCLQYDRKDWIIAETGGTTGRSKFTLYFYNEFYEAFVRPFKIVAEMRGFPRRASWFFIGPSGPHIIGRAAQACAQEMGSPSPFMVDFDPRWCRKFDTDSMPYQRYLDHVIDQSLHVIETQNIEVLFSTPRVLTRLCDEMQEESRLRIRGIHFGGMPLDNALLGQLQEHYPNAIFISGYGNTLFGMCPEFHGQPDKHFDYFPLGDRLHFRSISLDNDLTQRERLSKDASPGKRGQIVISRFDESILILNQIERDEAELIETPDHLAESGFSSVGIRNPISVTSSVSAQTSTTGLY